MIQYLPNFPMKSQRRSPDKNQDFNCVPTTLASMLQFLTGRDYEPNQVKDAVYGPNYVGPTAAGEYVTYCTQQGVHLFPVQGNATNLIWLAHQALIVGHPVILTEPDPYVPASYGWSHVVVFYGSDRGRLTAMDPWTGAPLTRSDPEWAGLLQFSEIWIGERIMNIPAGWKDDGSTLTAPNRVAVVRGFRDWIISHEWDPGNLPLGAEARRDPLEDSNPALGGGTWQAFRQNVLEWTAERGVFLMWAGQEIAHIRSQPAPVTPTINIGEVAASARLITETAQHLIEELQPPAKPV